jgi:hypothetical protein
MQNTITSQQNLSTPALRKFGFTLSTFFIGLFGLFLPWYWEKAFALWPFILGGILAVFALLLPKLLRYVYIPWMKLGHILGWVNTRIILGIIFFVLITPIGLVMRRFGYNAMARGYDPTLKSYRRVSEQRPIQHMEKPF